MFASNEDASLHLRSHIISWKSFCVETDVLLRRIYEITCDYFKADTSKELVQFDFISIQKLKEQRNVYGFTAKTSMFCRLTIFSKAKEIMKENSSRMQR